MNGEDKELQKSNERKSLLEPPGDDEDVAACIYTDWSNSPPSTSDEDAIRREELSHPANRKLPTKLNAMLSDPSKKSEKPYHDIFDQYSDSTPTYLEWHIHFIQL